MNSQDYSEAGLLQQPLIDMDQWQRLKTELGNDMLQEFAQEYFDETREAWLNADVDPFNVDAAAFRSNSHRSAGAGGTLGFKRLRHAFLCMEHNEFGEQSRQFHQIMKQVFEETCLWVEQQLG